MPRMGLILNIQGSAPFAILQEPSNFLGFGDTGAPVGINYSPPMLAGQMAVDLLARSMLTRLLQLRDLNTLPQCPNKLPTIVSTLTRPSRPLPTLIGCTFSPSSIQLGEYSKLGSTKVTTNLQAAAALAADALITFGPCWQLNKGRGRIQSSNKILNFLITTAINRGVFITIFTALNLILFFSRPGTFMLVIFLSDKIYMNSVLAILRVHVLRNHAQHPPICGSNRASVVQQLSLPVFEAARPHTTSTAVSTSHQSMYSLFPYLHHNEQRPETRQSTESIAITNETPESNI
ncbi:hypothetical protein B0H14DRAFT_2631963 [Mycena olivaceomarginata]|nr:hypothetical protein B0H14DRAFT_2631963 [Mycena olivaceomarginata]